MYKLPFSCGVHVVNAKPNMKLSFDVLSAFAYMHAITNLPVTIRIRSISRVKNLYEYCCTKKKKKIVHFSPERKIRTKNLRINAFFIYFFRSKYAFNRETGREQTDREFIKRNVNVYVEAMSDFFDFLYHK